MIGSVSTPPFAAAYADPQALVRNRERTQEELPQETTPPANVSSQGERVTISREARQLAQASEVGTSPKPAEQTGNPQAVQRKTLEGPEETQAAVAKSVAQAINAYHNNAFTNNIS